MAANAHKQTSPWLVSAGFSCILLTNFLLWYFWSQSNADGHPFMPKIALVVVIAVLTALQGAGIMALSMHLSKERQIVVGMAVLPFLTVALAIFPTLIDILTLKSHDQTYNVVANLKDYKNAGGHEAKAGAAHGESAEHGEKKAAPAAAEE